MNEVESKYFIDDKKFNCPFCRVRSVKYKILGIGKFDETNSKEKSVMFVRCEDCKKVSLHIVNGFLNSFLEGSRFVLDDYIWRYNCERKTEVNYYDYEAIAEEGKIDDKIILHIPTSFFTIDKRIKKELRELLNEATICYKNNAITGASACIRKAIYEFLNHQGATGKNYDEKIKSIKNKWEHITDYISILEGIKGMTSDEVHEGSLGKLDKSKILAYIDALQEIFNEVYVLPKEREERKQKIMGEFGETKKLKKEQEPKNDTEK